MRYADRPTPPATNRFTAPPSSVRTDVKLECVDPWGRSVEVPTTLSYRSDDPFAVTFTFRSAGDSVSWVVGRNLLTHGMSAPAGEGDVRVYPSIDTDARAVVVLDFRSPDGRLVAQVESAQIHTFLTQTFAVVPAGTESAFLDLDGMLADLLTEQND